MVRGRGSRPPRDLADFASYVRAFTRRYGSEGSFWSAHPEIPWLPVTTYEIWNEPNLEVFFPDQPTAPERYSDLYVLAAAAVRAADPAGRVLIGGLVPAGTGPARTTPRAFLSRMTTRHPDLWRYVDGVAYHAYGSDVPTIFERIDAVRTTLVQLGVGHLPIEISETGWASPPKTEHWKASQMRLLAEQLPQAGCGVTRLLPYTWLSDPSKPGPEGFGLAKSDGSLKPAGVAYRDEAGRTLRAEASAARLGPSWPANGAHVKWWWARAGASVSCST